MPTTSQADRGWRASLWNRNPLLFRGLGLTAVLALGDTLAGAMLAAATVGASAVFATGLTAIARRLVPPSMRRVVLALGAATAAAAVDRLVALAAWPIHAQAGIYLQVIAASAFVFDCADRRCEGVREALGSTVRDTTGLSCAAALVGAAREIAGHGSLAGIAIAGDGLAALNEPFGALLALALAAALRNALDARRP